MKNKKLIGTFAGFAAVLAFTFVFACFVPAAKAALAYTLKSEISNSSFSNKDTNDFANNWVISQSSDKATATVVSVSTTASEKPNKSEEDNVFSFAATEATRIGAKTETTTTLSSNSYYVLSVWAKTEGNVTFSFGTSGALSCEFLVEDKNNADWAEYKIYIATSVENAATANIELFLGSISDTTKTSEGTVLFDEVSLAKIDKAQFEKHHNEINCFTCDKRDSFATAQSAGAFVVADAATWQSEEDLEENQTISVFSHNFVIKTESSEDAGDADILTRNVLKVENNNEEKTLSAKSPAFTLNQFGIYRISFLVKSESEDSKDITSKLVLANEANKSQTTTLSSSTVNSSFNDFSEVIFFVRVGYSAHTTGTIEITVPAKTTILLDSFAVSNVSSTAFTSGTYKIDLLSSIDKGITNGFFTSTSESVKDGKPAAATTWETFGDTDKATMGIISIDPDASVNHFSYSTFSGNLNAATAPGYYKVNGEDIVLKTAYAISSDELVYAGIKSATISVSQSTKEYALITIYVQTQSASANISLFSGDKEIANKANIATNGEWQKVCFFVKPAESDTLSLSLKISLGSENTKSSGTLFISSATCISTTQNVYEAHKTAADAFDVFVDKTTFFSHVAILDNGTYEPFNFNVVLDETENVNAVGGVIDLANTTVVSDTKNANGENKGEYLVLKHEAEGYSHISHNAGITNSDKGFVKFETKVNIKNLVSGKAYLTFGDLGTIELSADAEADENGWVTCSVIAKTGTKTVGTVSTTLSLGSETEKAVGAILLDEIVCTTTDEESYDAALSANNATAITADISAEEENTEDDDKAVVNKKSTNLANNPTAIFFIALSSLLLVGIVIFVVIVYGVKRLPKRTRVNIQTHSNPKAKKTTKTNKNDKGFV